MYNMEEEKITINIQVYLKEKFNTFTIRGSRHLDAH